MDVEFLSNLLLSTRTVGINVTVEQLYIITELEKLVQEKGDDITIKEYKVLMDRINSELKPPEEAKK